MLRTFAAASLLAVLAAGLLGGCDRPPKTPEAPSGDKLEVLSVDPADPAEISRVKQAEAARAHYRYSLRTLEAFYYQMGDYVNLRWTRREMENLQQAQEFEFAGIEVAPPRELPEVIEADERELVERVVAARRAWLAALQRLEAYYGEQKADGYKYKVIRVVQQRFDPVHAYMYIENAELPPADLEPERPIPEADELYRQARSLWSGGKGTLRTFVTTDYSKQRRALELFRELIDRYPESDKIALAAYYIGEIYKEYFNENYLAVAWYQRAWQWDPYITQPARFQAATVYDRRLRMRDRAIDLYRASIEEDPERFMNDSYAKRRIQILQRAIADEQERAGRSGQY
jgi:tetratricopeptide (TPR) repeat protein